MEIVRDEPKISDKSKELVDKKPEKVVYDPTKKYTWEPSDVFHMSGSDFGVVLNAIGGILSTKDAQIFMLLQRASGIVENTLKNAVEYGVAKEILENEKNK